MPERLSYFTMGNVLVVSLVKAIGNRISALAEYEQRLCLPRIPAFVRCFSMEDLLNTRSRVICSSFVSLE